MRYKNNQPSRHLSKSGQLADRQALASGVTCDGVKTDRERINEWLDSIRETDSEARQEVIMRCETDSTARRFYVAMAKSCGF